jgi:hypothetical protein
VREADVRVAIVGGGLQLHLRKDVGLRP